jgi:ketosteroid isomerase-like protein
MEGSKSNVELVYETLGACMRGDEETLRVLMHPEGLLVIFGDPGIVNAGTYRGFDGYQRWVREWEEAWDEVNYELGELVEVGDAFLVAPVHVVGRGAGSGVEIDSTFGGMYEWRDGRATRFHVYPTVESALDVARKLAEE